MSKWDELQGEAGTPALDSRHDTPWPVNRREVVAGATALLVLNSLPGRAAQLQPVKADCSALFESLGFYTDLAFEWDSENKTLVVHENLESSKAQQDLVEDCIAELQGVVNDKARKSEHKKARADLKNLWEALRPDNARFRTWQTELSPLDPTPDIQLTRIKKPSFGYRLTILCAGRRIHENSRRPLPSPVTQHRADVHACGTEQMDSGHRHRLLVAENGTDQPWPGIIRRCRRRLVGRA